MARLKRIMVRLSLPMEEALTLLAERENRPEASVATEKLRQGLARTIESAECAERIAARRTQNTRDDYAYDRQTESGEVAKADGTA